MNAKTIIGVVFGMAAFFGVKYGVQYFTSIDRSVPAEVANNPAFQELSGELEKVEDRLNSSETVDEQLKVMEEAMTKTLPLVIDELTTMTAVKAGPGKKFTYEYVLKGGNVDNLTAKEIDNAMRPHLEKQYKSDAMKGFREGGIIAFYRYFNTKGKVMAEIEIKPAN